jgi:hypothetical protein
VQMLRFDMRVSPSTQDGYGAASVLREGRAFGLRSCRALTPAVTTLTHGEAIDLDIATTVPHPLVGRTVSVEAVCASSRPTRRVQ